MTSEGPLSGLLIVDKPAGITSHDVVARVRRIAEVKRVGHTGTLDPMATVVLVLCLGKATRLIPYMDEGTPGNAKEYEAVVRFGSETTTDDGEGEPRGPVGDPALLKREAVESAIQALTGDLQQVPPIYSAKKIEGERAYAKARRGEDVELAPVGVHVASAELLEFCGATAVIRYECSRGTYIRALARDLGRTLDVGAHLVGLRRTRSGLARIDGAVRLDTLSFPSLAYVLRPMSHALPAWSAVVVDSRELADLKQGRGVTCRAAGIAATPRVRVCDEAGSLAALARCEQGRLEPFCVF